MGKFRFNQMRKFNVNTEYTVPKYYVEQVMLTYHILLGISLLKSISIERLLAEATTYTPPTLNKTRDHHTAALVRPSSSLQSNSTRQLAPDFNTTILTKHVLLLPLGSRSLVLQQIVLYY